MGLSDVMTICNYIVLIVILIMIHDIIKQLKCCIDKLKWIENYLLEDRRIKLKEIKKNEFNSSRIC